MVVLSIFLPQKYFFFSFASNFSFSRRSHVGSLFINTEQKGKVHDVVHTSAFFIMSQTARYQMAAITAVFSRLSHVDFFYERDHNATDYLVSVSIFFI